MTSLTFPDLIKIRKKSSNRLVNLVKRAKNIRMQGEGVGGREMTLTTHLVWETRLCFSVHTIQFNSHYKLVIWLFSPILPTWKLGVRMMSITVECGRVGFPGHLSFVPLQRKESEKNWVAQSHAFASCTYNFYNVRSLNKLVLTLPFEVTPELSKSLQTPETRIALQGLFPWTLDLVLLRYITWDSEHIETRGFPMGGCNPLLDSLPGSIIRWPAPTGSGEQSFCKIVPCAQCKV